MQRAGDLQGRRRAAVGTQDLASADSSSFFAAASSSVAAHTSVVAGQELRVDPASEDLEQEGPSVADPVVSDLAVLDGPMHHSFEDLPANGSPAR